MRGALVLLAVMACKGTQEQPPPPRPAQIAPAAPAIPVVHQSRVDEGYIVVVPKDGDADATIKLVRARLAAALLDGTVEKLPAKPWDSKRRELEQMDNKHLAPADLDGISAGTRVALRVTGEPIATLRALAPIAHDAAVAAHGWVVDPGSGGTFTTADFEKHIPGDVIDVSQQIMIHEIRGDGEEPWLDTMGMSKLGFPELVITDAATGDLSQLGTLMNAVAQTLLAHPDIQVPGTIDVDLRKLPGDWFVDKIKDGGTGRARFRTSWHKDEDGEDEIELAPAEGSGTEGFEALVVGCFGARPDVPTRVAPNDPELVAAAQHARSELSALRAHFAKGVPYNEQLRIKGPFTSDDGRTEWMWVDVVRWTGDTLEGTLDNEPVVVKTLKAGAHVKVPFAKVADFIHVSPDGKKTGGYSMEVYKKRGEL